MANDFKAFADAGGANVISQSAYTALTALINNGFVSGVALSAQVNKVFRQATVGSYLLGQIISDSGLNASDDGDLATLLSNLKTAISGRLINVQSFSTPGTFVYTPTAGTKKIRVTVQGAGGAGGGSPATSAAQVAPSGGGGAGAICIGILTSGFSGVNVVVGSGGLGVVGGNGAAGTASSFGSVMTSPGGSGTGVGSLSTGLIIQGGTGQSAIATGGTIFNGAGGNGQPGVATTVTNAVSGNGAASFFGGSAPGANSTNPGGNNLTAGGGGGGALCLASGAAQKGGNGGSGFVMIEEFV